MNQPLPLPYRGQPGPIKIKASMLGRQQRACPGRLTMDSRPSIASPEGWLLRQEPWPFLLGAVTSAVTAIHNGAREQTAIQAAQREVSKAGLGFHPLAREFIGSAVWNYLEAHADREAVVGPLNLTDERQINFRGRDGYPSRALTAWGLHYQSPDGAIREIHRLRYSQARSKEPDDEAWAAVAAKLAVDGMRINSSDRDPDPERVLIVEIGLSDANANVIFDLDAVGARDLYERIARPRIDTLTTATTLRPCRDCQQCRWLAFCPGISTARGLLGQPGPGTHTRSISASDLDRYATCPAQYFGNTVLHLPRENNGTTAQTRGLSVHKWLAAAHHRDGHPRCSDTDLPEPGTSEPACADILTSEEYREAWPFLRQHLSHCPVQDHTRNSITVEPPHYVYDPDADVVVAATPDLTYSMDTTPIWRETKTTLRPLPANKAEALQQFLAISLDIVLLASASNGEGSGTAHRWGIVELEVLGRHESRILAYDTSDVQIVTQARKLLAAAAVSWHRDRTFAPHPSNACSWCPVSQWCPSRGQQSAPLTSQRDLEAGLDRDITDIPF